MGVFACFPFFSFRNLPSRRKLLIALEFVRNLSIFYKRNIVEFEAVEINGVWRKLGVESGDEPKTLALESKK